MVFFTEMTMVLVIARIYVENENMLFRRTMGFWEDKLSEKQKYNHGEI